MNKGDNTFKIIKNKINSVGFMERNRNSEKDFIRHRKMPFVSLILFMINLVKFTKKTNSEFFYWNLMMMRGLSLFLN